MPISNDPITRRLAGDRPSHDQAELASAADRLDTDRAVLAARDEAPPLSPEAEIEEAERAAEIDRSRSELEVTLTAALRELGNVEAAYQFLVDGLYDVEFAEGHGVDIAHHLDIAAKALRAADALRFRAVTPTRTS